MTKQSQRRSISVRFGDCFAIARNDGKEYAFVERLLRKALDSSLRSRMTALMLAILTFGSCTLAYAIVNIFRKMPLQASIYASIYECVRNQRLLG